MIQWQKDHLDKKMQNLYLIFDEWPSHFTKAYGIDLALDRDSSFYRNVLLCGMGGSATSCDVASQIASMHTRVPFNVARGNDIPKWVGKQTLVIVESASGNTEESVEMLKEASKTGAEVKSVSSGGIMRDTAEALGQKQITIPNIGPPRACLPYLLQPLLKLVDQFCDLSIKEDIWLIEKTLSKIATLNNSKAPSETSTSKKLANFLGNGFVICFASPYLIPAATRLKNSLNENAKVHCIRESVLEGSHNEIVPFTFSSESADRKVILLRWEKDTSLVRDRFARIDSFLTQIGEPIWDIMIQERSLLNAILAAIYLLDYATIYLARMLEIDPSPTPAIDILKSRVII